MFDPRSVGGRSGVAGISFEGQAMSNVAATPLGSQFASPPRSRFAARFHYLYAMFAIAIYEGAFTQSFRFARGDEHLLPGQTEIVSTITQAIILSVLVVLVWIKRGEFARALKNMLPYLLILALCAVSALWSDYPFPTLRRSVTLTSCVFFGIYCYVTFGLRGTVAILGRTTVLLALLSLVTFVLLPSVGRETAFGYEGAMRGVFPQKNTMGEAMLLAISCYLFQLIEGSKTPRAALAAVGLLLVSIVVAQSATSLVLAMIVIAVGLIFYSARDWRLRWMVIYGFALLGSLILIVFVFDSDAIFAVLNRDPSFTGRLPLWQMSLRAIMLRPWLGYGYSGFWNQDSPTVQYIWWVLDWQAPSAHNGYLDICLQIGVVGVALYLWVWGKTITLSLRASANGGPPEAKWILLFMLINVLLNLDEGPLPYPDQFTVMMPGAILLLEQWRQGRAALARGKRGGPRFEPTRFAAGRWQPGQRA